MFDVEFQREIICVHVFSVSDKDVEEDVGNITSSGKSFHNLIETKSILLALFLIYFAVWCIYLCD